MCDILQINNVGLGVPEFDGSDFQKINCSKMLGFFSL
jgi:hypothetical protein